MKMCRSLAALRQDVTLLGYFKGNKREVFSFYGIPPIFEILNIPSLFGHATDGPYIFGSWIRTLHLKPDLAYGRSLEACLLVALSGIPTVFEAHRLPRTPLAEFSARLLFKLTNFVALVVITEELAGLFTKKRFLPSHKILIAHSGADPDEADHDLCQKGLEKIPPKAKNYDLQVGYVGHLYPGKGMEVIAQLVRLAPWAFFHVVGGRDEDVRLWKTRLGNAPNIHFYGFVPPVQTSLFRKHFDIALAPYQEAVRNTGTATDTGVDISPIKVIEYMASGLPVLASDLKSIREIISHGETGFLLPPGDPHAWVSCLEYLRNNPEERKRIGLRAKSVFLEKYTWEARARKILSFVENHFSPSSNSSSRNSIFLGSGGDKPSSLTAIRSSSG